MKLMIIFKNAATKKNEEMQLLLAIYWEHPAVDTFTPRSSMSTAKSCQVLEKSQHSQRKDNVLLLVDLYKSHLLNYDFMKMMKDNNVVVCGFSAHCTHLLQPLEYTPFA